MLPWRPAGPGMPEADRGRTYSGISVHDAFEIDSVDPFTIVLTLEAEPGLSIPNGDDSNISSLNGSVHDLPPRLEEKARETAAGAP